MRHVPVRRFSNAVRSMCIAGIGWSVFTAGAVAIAADTSCNGLQLTQQENRLARLKGELTPEQTQQLQRTIDGFRQTMEKQLKEVHKIEHAHQDLLLMHEKAVIEASPALAQRYKDAVAAVAQENPTLAPGDRDFKLVVLARLWNNPQFSQQLNRRLEGDAEHQQLILRDLKLQMDEMHPTEKQQHNKGMATRLPQAEQERFSSGASTKFVETQPMSLEQKGTLKTAIDQSRAFRELIVTEAAFGRAKRGSLTDQNYEAAVADTQLVVDTPAEADVVVVVSRARDVVRRTESTRLEATLNGIHIPKYLPQVEERPAVMRDRERPLTVELNQRIGLTLQKINEVKDITREIARVELLPPPVVPDPMHSNKFTHWMRKEAGKVQDVLRKITTKYQLDP